LHLEAAATQPVARRDNELYPSADKATEVLEARLERSSYCETTMYMLAQTTQGNESRVPSNSLQPSLAKNDTVSPQRNVHHGISRLRDAVVHFAINGYNDRAFRESSAHRGAMQRHHQALAPNPDTQEMLTYCATTTTTGAQRPRRRRVK